MSITMIGLDIAKASFQVHGVDEEGRAKIKRKLRRMEVTGFSRRSPDARWCWRRAGLHTTGAACWAHLGTR